MPIVSRQRAKEKRPAGAGRGKASNLAVFLERAFEPFPEGNDPGPGQKVVDQQSADGGLDGAPAHMEPEIFARELWHRSVSSSGLLAVSLLTFLA